MTFPHNITIRRLSASGNKYIYQDIYTSRAFVQPLDIESSNLLNQGFSQGSVVYLPIDTDIIQNDNVVFDSTTYGVRGVKTYKFGNLTHKKALLEEVI